MNGLLSSNLLVFLVISVSLVTLNDGRKVSVTRTVKKTIRRIPAKGAPTEKHFVHQEHYTSGSEDGALMAQQNAGASVQASSINIANHLANPAPSGLIGDIGSSNSQLSIGNTGDYQANGGAIAGGRLMAVDMGPNRASKIGVSSVVLRDEGGGRGREVLGQSFGCPSGWTQWNVNGACYLVIRQVCNWDQCEAECVRQGGHLTSVHSQAENEFIYSLTNNWMPGYEIVTSQERSSGDLGEIQFKSYWIGMHRDPVGPVSCGGPKNTVCIAGSFVCQWSDSSAMDYGCITHSITAPVGYPWRGGPAGATGIGMPDFSSKEETCITIYPRYFSDRREQPWHGLWNDLNCGWTISGGICKLTTVNLGVNGARNVGVSSKTVILRDEGVDVGREEGIEEEIKEEVPIGGGFGVQRDSGVVLAKERNKGGDIVKTDLVDLNDEELTEKDIDDSVRKSSTISRPRPAGQRKSTARVDANAKGDMLEEELTDEELIRREQDGGNGCGAEWQEYNGYCYKLVQKKLNWEEAEKECQNEHAHLTSIRDKIENEFVAALTAKFVTNFDNFCDGFWIGMTRKLVPGMDTHKSDWIDGTKVTFGNVPKHTEFFMPPWRGGQPDDPQNGVEECVHMYPKLGCDSKPQIYYGQWNDFGCSKELAGAVCKKRSGGRLSSSRSNAETIAVQNDESGYYSGRRGSKIGANDGMVEEELTDVELSRRELDGGSGICGLNWQEYNGYCYKLITKQLNWEEGEDECRNEHAHLASIRDKSENEFVAALTAKYETNFENFCDGFWIGMTRKLLPGMDIHKSKWVDGTKVTFGNVPKHTEFFMPPWRGGQPDNPTQGIEECVHMYPKLGCDSKPQIYYGQWNDFGCSKKLAGVVCKRRA